MRRFIRYLYEYENGQRTRNVGFAKVEERENSTSVSIHGKGLRLKGDETLKLYIFYMDDNVCRGIWQGDIENVNPALNYRLIFTEEDTGRPDNYSQIEGIILEMPGNRKLAAMWNDMDVNVDEMRLWDAEPNAEPESVEEPESEGECLGNFSAEPNAGPESIAGPESEGKCLGNFSAVPKSEQESAEGPESEGKCLGNFSAVPKSEQESAERPESEGKCLTNSCEVPRPGIEPEIDRYMPTTEPQIERIDRKDIARLPRCEWRLANNSFLLHGYNNYHYLILTEDDEGFWLGVPGIFHEREAKAAEAFGFPRFLAMEDDEFEAGNSGEKFGYWCRKVRRGI